MKSKTTLAGIEISHPEKVIFPNKKITKKDMAEYYTKVAHLMLPYLKDRPLTLQRFPDGIGQPGFYQKNAGEYFPAFVQRVKIKTQEGMNEQVVCNSKKTLVYLANQGTVVFHVWLSRTDMLDRPDRVVFDLDPPRNAFEKVKEAARHVGDFLLQKGKSPQLMTTGKNGLHVWYKKRRSHGFDQVRDRARDMAEEMVKKFPHLLTTETRIKKRGGKIFVDYLRNAYGQTAVRPYSLRPTPEAGVAVPLSWEGLAELKSGHGFHYGNVGGSER